MSYGEGQMTGFGFMRIIPVSCCLGTKKDVAAAYNAAAPDPPGMRYL